MVLYLGILLFSLYTSGSDEKRVKSIIKRGRDLNFVLAPLYLCNTDGRSF